MYKTDMLIYLSSIHYYLYKYGHNAGFFVFTLFQFKAALTSAYKAKLKHIIQQGPPQSDVKFQKCKNLTFIREVEKGALTIWRLICKRSMKKLLTQLH